MTSAPPIEIHGECAPQFERVRAAFEENFRTRGDIGAAVSIWIGAHCLVDLWAGVSDPVTRSPWQKDTVVNLWSTTKGVTAACFAMAVDGGVFKYGDRVAKYWPEFAAHGKADVTIAQLLSHQAGLCGFRSPTGLEALYDLRASATELAAMEPFWKPGTKSGYHAITGGLLLSELFRRAEGRTIGQYVRDELNSELGLDISIGLPGSAAKRCATIVGPEVKSAAFVDAAPTPEQVAALANPPLEPCVANDDAWRAAEIPSANGHATARAVAELYGRLARGLSEEGVAPLSGETIRQATSLQCEGIDCVLSIEARWACGFLLSTNGMYGPDPAAFGHSGWGGSFAFGHPRSGAGMAYIMNRMGTELVGDPRNQALIDAFFESVA